MKDNKGELFGKGIRIGMTILSMFVLGLVIGYDSGRRVTRRRAEVEKLELELAFMQRHQKLYDSFNNLQGDPAKNYGELELLVPTTPTPQKYFQNSFH